MTVRTIALATALVLVAGTAQAADFVLKSAQLTDGGRIPDAQVFDGFGCTGGNVSPELQWSGAPEGTKSFAVTVYDPDAPTGSGWWHWVVFDLPASVSELPAGASGALPEGAVESRTDFGAPGYGGPCPPQGHGDHRYVFTVHALKTESLPLDAQASGAMVGFYLNANALGTASLTATYGR